MPVVLNVGGRGDVIPRAMILNGQFGVALGVAQQEIGEIIPSERTIELERALRIAEQILGLCCKEPSLHPA